MTRKILFLARYFHGVWSRVRVRLGSQQTENAWEGNFPCVFACFWTLVLPLVTRSLGLGLIALPHQLLENDVHDIRKFMLGPLGLAHSVNTACRRTVGLNVGHALTSSVIRDQHPGIHQLTKMPSDLSRLLAATDE